MSGIPHTSKHTEVLTVDIADAYTAGDVLDGLIDLRGLMSLSGGKGGTIRQIRIVDRDQQAAALRLYFFDAQPTNIDDDAPFAGGLLAADIDNLIATIDIAAGNYVTVTTSDEGDVDYAIKDDIDLSWRGELWLYVTPNGSTPNWTNADALRIIIPAWIDA